MTQLVESSIKISCILLVALFATALLRRRSAALRHWILAAAIFCAGAAPLLQRVVPSWQLPNIVDARVRGAIDGEHSLVASLSNHERARSGSSFDPFGWLRVALSESKGDTLRTSGNDIRLPRAAKASSWSGVESVWLGGTAVSVLILFIGLSRLAWITSRARRVEIGEWAQIATAVSREFGLARPVRLLQSRHATLLVTWGLLRPSILLPAGARDWSGDRIRIVLYHELAHVRRGDWLVQMAAEVVKAACWFNPLVWIACRRLRQEGEQAADDAVLCRGIDGRTYATELVDLARTFARQRQTWLPAPAIARASSLERRIKAMLNARVNRRPASRLARIATLAALTALAVAIASAQNIFSSFSGVVYDPLNGLLPGVTMVLTNAQTGAKYEIRSDRMGHFQFVGLPPGRYSLDTELLGFMPLRGSLEIGGQDVQRDVRLQIGSLQETVSVRASSAGAPVPETSWRASRPATESRCTPAPPGVEGGLGGNLRPPTKLVSVEPRYPPTLSSARQGGTVVLDARIGTDGLIRDVRTISSTHPDFELAAVDAVRQWEFSQTLLNCVPVEVAMTVTVHFSAE